VAWWKFDEMTGTTALDSSGHGNAGVVRGSSRVPGRYAQALSFDGLDDWVEVPDSESLHGIRHLTVEAWVMLKGFPPAALHDWTGIIAYGTKAQGIWELFVTHEGGVRFLLNWQTATETRITTSPVLKIDEWHQVIATYDGVTARVFVDGALEGEAACPELVYPDGEPHLAIGLDFPGEDEFFDGLIDDVLIYDKALVPDELPRFRPNDLVKVDDAPEGFVNVRTGAASGVRTTVPEGWVLTILDDHSTPASLQGVTHNWWRVRSADYIAPSEASTGWVAEEFLTPVSGRELVPSEPPASFVSGQDDVDAAVRYAQEHEGSMAWYEPGVTYCLKFVRNAYAGTSLGWTCPNDAIQRLGDSFYEASKAWNPPKGALVFFSVTDAGWSEFGHVGLALGGSHVAHVSGAGPVRIDSPGDVVALSYIGDYLGWAYPPEEWLDPDSSLTGVVAGNWSGLLTQNPDPSSQQFYYHMTIIQDGATLSGTTRIAVWDEPQYFARMTFTGTCVGDKVTFSEHVILESTTQAGWVWCIKSGELMLSEDGSGYSLVGRWWGPLGCSGFIQLTRSGE
jgi:hypothetical protein